MDLRALAEVVAEEAGRPIWDVETILALTIYKIVQTVAKGEEVKLRTFGTFRVKTRASRIYRHPKTGEKKRAPQNTVVSFVPAPVFAGLVSPKRYPGQGKFKRPLLPVER